jgi:hypothetical protein
VFWLVLNDVSTVFGIIGGIVMFWQGIGYWINKRKYERKLQSLTEARIANHQYVINVSSHPIEHSQDNWLEGKTVLNLPFQVNEGRNIEGVQDLIDEADRLIRMIPEDVMKDIKSASEVVFAVPGMSSFTVILIAKLHALSGVFPLVTFALRDMENGGRQVWQKPVDLHHVRNTSRMSRWVNPELLPVSAEG